MRICGTGHRPYSLPCKYDENHEWAILVKKRIEAHLKRTDPEIVIVGGAIGFDTWLAEASLNLGIETHLYMPFPGQGLNWPKHSYDRFLKIKEQCEEVIIVDQNYSKKCFLDRDERMVDDSDFVLSLWNPEMRKGGTFHTLCYAKETNKSTLNLWPS